jgi:hypothetical protein
VKRRLLIATLLALLSLLATYGTVLAQSTNSILD